MLFVFLLVLLWSSLTWAQGPISPMSDIDPPRFYVCGNEEKVLWTLETREDLHKLAQAPHPMCASPLLLTTIPNEHLEAQRTMATEMPYRHLTLVDGLMVPKSDDEKRAVDTAREAFMHQQRSERFARRAADAGTIRYVQIGGSDNASCLEGYPCRTIQNGINRMQPFDTLYVGSGYYNESPLINKDNVTVMRAPNAPTKPVVNAPFIVRNPRSGVTIDGIISDGDNHKRCYCFWTADGTFDITIKNCEARRCCGQGILASGERHHYENNIFLENGKDPEFDHNIYINGDSHTIVGNYLYGGKGYNMQCSQNGGCSNSVIERNTWTGSGKGFTMDSQGSNIFRNNLMFDDAKADGGQYCARAQYAPGSKWLNNTFVNCGVYIRSDSPGTEVAGNIFTGGYKITNQVASNMHHNIFADPGLSAAPKFPGDAGYRLLPGATAAIGQAPCIPAVPNDIDGHSRPQGGSCDLGANEQMAQGVTDKPQHLAWVVNPTTVTVGAPITPAPVVHVHYDDHTLVADATPTITMSATGCGILSCGPDTCTKPAIGGVSTWSRLTLSTPGTNCTLQAVATLPGGIDTEPSSAFTVTQEDTVTPGLSLGQCVVTKSGEKQTLITCTQGP